jgi:hypothetical protein
MVGLRARVRRGVRLCLRSRVRRTFGDGPVARLLAWSMPRRWAGLTLALASCGAGMRLLIV